MTFPLEAPLEKGRESLVIFDDQNLHGEQSIRDYGGFLKGF